MSMMRCDGCDNFIDTDECVEGLFEDASPYRYWCEGCVMRAFEDPVAGGAIVEAMKIQDPATFKDLTETWA